MPRRALVECAHHARPTQRRQSVSYRRSCSRRHWLKSVHTVYKPTKLPDVEAMVAGNPKVFAPGTINIFALCSRLLSHQLNLFCLVACFFLLFSWDGVLSRVCERSLPCSSPPCAFPRRGSPRRGPAPPPSDASQLQVMLPMSAPGNIHTYIQCQQV